MLEMLALAFALGTANYHLPHDPTDPEHWYDIYCCDMRHCRPAKEGEVKQEGLGYRIGLEFIPFDDSRVLPSQDAQVHVCTVNRSVRCLYLPGIRS